MKRLSSALLVAAAFIVLSSSEARAQYVTYFPPTAARTVAFFAPAPTPWAVPTVVTVASPVIPAPSLATSVLPAPTLAPPVATVVAPAPVPVTTVAFMPAPTVAFQPVARTVTRFRPILGGTVTRVQYGWAPVVVSP